MKKLLVTIFLGFIFLSCNSASTEKQEKEIEGLRKLNMELKASNSELKKEIATLKERNRMLKDGNADLFRKIESLCRELKALKKETSL